MVRVKKGLVWWLGVGLLIWMVTGRTDPVLAVYQASDQTQKIEPSPSTTGEIIVKLNEQSAFSVLAKQSYLTRKIHQDQILNRMRSRYGLRNGRPVFQAKHDELKAKNMSLQTLAKLRHQQPDQALDLMPVYSVNTDEEVLSACERLKKDPEIDYAEPNYLAQALYVPTDPQYSQQWAHQKTQAEQAWNLTRGNSNTIIAVVDTGVDYSHEDLAANVWRDGSGRPGKDFVDIYTQAYVNAGYRLVAGEDYTSVDYDPADYYGHGTHCAGIAAAVEGNAKGVAGVCPQCRIMPVRAGFSIIDPIYGEGGRFEYDDIANAVMYAADSGAKIISMSFGGSGDSQTMKNAINYAHQRGVLLIAAAGNSNTDSAFYPAAYDPVVSVAATNINNAKAYYSNYGYRVDVAAPGGDATKDSMILSTVPKIGTLSDPSGYKVLQGTSMACPYVAGLAGLRFSLDSSKTNAEMREVLRQAVDLPSGTTYYIGRGRINALKTLTVNPLAGAVAKITSPKNGDFLTHLEVLDILGTATGGARVSLAYYGPGLYSTTGGQIADVAGSYDNQKIAAWNLGLIPDSVYQIRLSVRGNNESEVVDDWATFTIARGIKPGWPFVTGGESIALVSAPVAADINHDHVTEILAASHNFRIYGWHPDGTLDPLFFMKDLGGTAGFSSPALADMDGDGDLDVVVGTETISSHFPYGAMYVLDHYGQNLPGWPAYEVGGFRFSPVVGDLDGDNSLEIVSSQDGGLGLGISCENDSNCPACYDFSAGQVCGFTCDMDSKSCVHYSRGVFAWRADGSPLTGWPIRTNGVVRSSPALGDIDRDGHPEILTTVDSGSNGYLYAWRYDGTVVPGWPVLVDNSQSPTSIVSPVLFDVNGDFSLEVIASGKLNGNNYIFVFDKNGYQLNRWPYSVVQDMAISDLKGDGNFSLIFGTWTQKVYVIDVRNGSVRPGWPVAFNGIPDESPVVGDIDGDGDKEILFNGHGQPYLYAWHDDGRPVSGFPKLMSGSAGSAPALIEDSDGTVDVVASSLDGRVYAWDLPASYDAGNIDWPVFHRDIRHTNCYPRSSGLVDCTSLLNEPPTITVSPPSPMTARVGIPMTFQVSVSDGDGDFVDVNVTGLPGGASFDAQTGQFSWTPAADQIGVFTVTLTATDRKEKTEKPVVISVLPPPMIVTMGSGSALPGETAVVSVHLSSLSLEPISYFGFNLLYDEALVEPLQLITSSITENWDLYGVDTAPGLLYVLAFSNSEPLSEAGELMRIVFRVLPTAKFGARSPLTIEDFDFEGSLPDEVRNGFIDVLDSTPPLRPQITDEGTLTNRKNQLSASWSSSDPESGISEYQYAVSDTSGQPNIVPWTSVGTNASVTKTGLNLKHGMTYYFWVKAKNGEGVWSEASYSDGIKVDIIPPTGSIKINNPLGAPYTRNRSVTLYLSSLDEGRVYSDGQMKFSQDGGITWTPSEIYTPTKSLTLLSPGDGTKTVYVRFKDPAGNWSSTYGASILLDTTLPVGTVVINKDVSNTISTQVRLDLTALERGSGMNYMMISNDGVKWMAQLYSYWTNWNLSPGYGLKTVYVKLVDKAGNTSQIISDTIYYAPSTYSSDSTAVW